MLVTMLQPLIRVSVALATVLVLSGCTQPAEQASAATPQASQVAAIAASAFVVVPAAERQPVPAWDGRLLDDSAWSSAQLTGKVTVVNFWASWCAPCAAEWPELVAANTELTDVQFLGFNEYDDVDDARAFVGAYGDAYAHVFDPNGTFFESLSGMPTGNLPTTIVVDAEGRIAAWKTGVVTGIEIKKAVARV